MCSGDLGRPLFALCIGGWKQISAMLSVIVLTTSSCDPAGIPEWSA
jgi:hypothetical protein